MSRGLYNHRCLSGTKLISSVHPLDFLRPSAFIRRSQWGEVHFDVCLLEILHSLTGSILDSCDCDIMREFRTIADSISILASQLEDHENLTSSLFNAQILVLLLTWILYPFLSRPKNRKCPDSVWTSSYPKMDISYSYRVDHSISSRRSVCKTVRRCPDFHHRARCRSSGVEEPQIVAVSNIWLSHRRTRSHSHQLPHMPHCSSVNPTLANEATVPKLDCR